MDKYNPELQKQWVSELERARKKKGSELRTKRSQKFIGKPFQQPDYPVAALGCFRDVVVAISESAQLDVALAGQSVLAAAALLAQSCANVETFAGVKPLSNYFLTIADSGSGKSLAENVVLQAIVEWQKDQSKHYLREKKLFEENLKNKGKDVPAPPVEPYILSRDATAEGIRKNFQRGRASQGLYTSEGSSFTDGWSMSTENKSRTCAALNGIWDNGVMSISRAGEDRTELFDRRLSIHLLMQPNPAQRSLKDLSLVEMGFLPRFLVTWVSASKPRKARPFVAKKIGPVVDFWAQCKELLDITPIVDLSRLPVITMDDSAKQKLSDYFEVLDMAAKGRGDPDTGDSGNLSLILPFVVRCTEHVCRMAGVLSVFEALSFCQRRTISGQTMADAIQLINYSLETWRGIYGDREDALLNEDAQRLLGWMQKKGGECWETSMLQIMRPRITAERRDNALGLLHKLGLIKYLRQKFWTAAP